MRFLILLKGGEKGKELVVVVLYYKVTQNQKNGKIAAHQEVEKPTTTTLAYRNKSKLL